MIQSDFQHKSILFFEYNLKFWFCQFKEILNLIDTNPASGILDLSKKKFYRPLLCSLWAATYYASIVNFPEKIQ